VIGLFLLLALQVIAPQAKTVPSDEIVVTAERRRCNIRLANQVLSAPDFDRHAAQWAAGRPVQVVVPTDAKVKCLAKIMFRLADHGVKQAAFVGSTSAP